MAEVIHRRLIDTDQKQKSLLRKAYHALVNNVHESDKVMDEPQFQASADLRIPEDISPVEAAYLIKLGLLANAGNLFRMDESGEVSQVDLNLIQPSADHINPEPSIHLTPQTIKHIIGERTLASELQEEASTQETELQGWYSKLATLWKDREEHPLFLKTPKGRFPTSLNGIDDASDSLDFPYMERYMSDNPRIEIINIPYPHRYFA